MVGVFSVSPFSFSLVMGGGVALVDSGSSSMVADVISIVESSTVVTLCRETVEEGGSF